MSDPWTAAVHGGPDPDASTGALVDPIVQSTTFAAEAPDAAGGFDYSRSGNPTVAALEQRLQSLAGCIGAVGFSSGMAAIDTTLRALVEPGEVVLASEIAYGGTQRLFREAYQRWGVDVVPVDTTSPAEVEAEIDRASLVFLETPANPTLEVADLTGIAELAHEEGVPVAVDNTFQTPIGQPALDLGADVAIHSTTKYIEGHGTAVGGAVLTNDPEVLTDLQHLRKTVGTIAEPFQAWLTLRGLETLPLRLERVSQTAGRLAEALAEHPAVEGLAYPGHPSHPQHEVAQAHHDLHGGLLAADLGSREAVDRFLDELDVVTLAEHLGTSRTLVTHPATMTHDSVPAPRRRELGITDGLIRLSVGLEAPETLIEDLETALEATRSAVQSRG